MNQPAALQIGDQIGIVSPAGKIAKEKVEHAIRVIEDFGLKVKLGKHVYDQHHQFAGKDEDRLKDFQDMIDDPEIKAILCSRGGYGAIRIVDRIDFSSFHENLKWIVGYSDITVFHTLLNRMGIQSMHACMPINFDPAGKSNAVKSMLNMLTGTFENYEIPSHSLNRLGNVSAELTGGNLSILYSLQASKYEMETDDKILFIEDISEELYHLDRMMNNLKLSGKLSKLKGLIVGGMTDMFEGNQPFGQSANEIIHSYVKDYNYPIVYDFPAGHIDENLALLFGKEIHLQVNQNVVNLSWI